MNNLYENTIRIIAGARKYCFGDTLLYKLASKHVYLVLIASDAGAATSKKIVDKCKYYKVPCYQILNVETFKTLMQKNIVSFGVTDENLAIKLIENLNKGGLINEKQQSK